MSKIDLKQVFKDKAVELRNGVSCIKLDPKGTLAWAKPGDQRRLGKELCLEVVDVDEDGVYCTVVY